MPSRIRGGTIKQKTLFMGFVFALAFLILSAPVSAVVSASGMNSCSKGWYHTGGTFLNYCPNCGSSGTLSWNPKGTAEGEWTCMACDSDYCVCGRCKARGSGIYLIRATKHKKHIITEKLNKPVVKASDPIVMVVKLKDPLFGIKEIGIPTETYNKLVKSKRVF